MNRTAVAAPAQEPTDDCNWLPMSAMRRTYHGTEGNAAIVAQMCNQPCVQHWDMRVMKQTVRMHRCADHKLDESFVGRMSTR